MNTNNSLFSYYGGKARMKKHILSLFPKHKSYIEPFCGGASVLFFKNRSGLEVLNDNNVLVVNIYRVMQDEEKFKKLMHRLNYTLYSKKEHVLSIEICKKYNSNKFSDIEKAWAFWFNIENSFSNILNATFSRDISEKNHRAISFENKKKNFYKCFSRLRGVTIEYMDALDCIRKYDNKDAFFYVDPPYIERNQGHYMGYTVDDYVQLIDLLSNIKGKFVLSGYDNEYVNKKWNKKYVEIFCVAGSKKKSGRIEFLWYNFDKNDMCGLGFYR